MQLRDSVCLVTGGSGGLGGAIARELAARGATPVLNGRRRDALEEAAVACGGRALPGDLRDPDVPAALVEQTVRLHGRLDVLIANAGLGSAGRLEAMPPAAVHELLDVNLRAPALLARAALPVMADAGRGHLALISSIAGLVGRGDEALYAATKSGAHALWTSLRQAQVHPGVSLSVVVPGVVDTDFFRRRGQPYTRRWPRPVPPRRVALAVVDAIERGRREVYVPAWLRVPARLAGGAPGLYQRLAARYG